MFGGGDVIVFEILFVDFLGFGMVCIVVGWLGYVGEDLDGYF